MESIWRWFREYQHVCINICNFSTLIVILGVPQGSLLGVIALGTACRKRKLIYSSAAIVSSLLGCFKIGVMREKIGWIRGAKVQSLKAEQHSGTRTNDGR